MTLFPFAGRGSNRTTTSKPQHSTRFYSFIHIPLDQMGTWSFSRIMRNVLQENVHRSPDVIVTLQTVQLRDRFHAASADSLADVPNFDATFAAGVNVLGRIGDGDRADHFAMSQSVNLARVTWDSWSYQSIGGKRYGLQLALAVHMEGIRSAEINISLSANDRTRRDGRLVERLTDDLTGCEDGVGKTRAIVNCKTTYGLPPAMLLSPLVADILM